jgi:hypothetical protein
VGIVPEGKVQKKCFGAKWIYILHFKPAKIHSETECFNGCETWSLALKEAHNLRVCENKVLMRISEPEREEMENITQCVGQ